MEAGDESGTDEAKANGHGQTVTMSFGAVVWAIVVTIGAATPLAISGWAFLDAAKRPSWAWSLAGRSQIAWMGFIALGVITLIGGLAISGWYLLQVRPRIAAAESGDLGA